MEPQRGHGMSYCICAKGRWCRTVASASTLVHSLASAARHNAFVARKWRRATGSAHGVESCLAAAAEPLQLRNEAIKPNSSRSRSRGRGRSACARAGAAGGTATDGDGTVAALAHRGHREAWV